MRSLFSEDVVSIIQNDAIERRGWKQLLFEPELLATVKPDIQMVGTLMALKGKIPEKTKETARLLVQAVVEDLMARMKEDMRRAVTGALNKRQHTPLPSLSGLDWKRTIQRNLKHYDRERSILVPEKFYYFDRARRNKEWTVILDIDQSGSMAESVIWASVTGAVFASMPALDTRVVVFDTEVVDLTEQCANDPVDMLFGIQLGGGTDINKSVAYCEPFIEDPKKRCSFWSPTCMRAATNPLWCAACVKCGNPACGRCACWHCRIADGHSMTNGWRSSSPVTAHRVLLVRPACFLNWWQERYRAAI